MSLSDIDELTFMDISDISACKDRIEFKIIRHSGSRNITDFNWSKDTVSRAIDLLLIHKSASDTKFKNISILNKALKHP
jgi:hypothetical protein